MSVKARILISILIFVLFLLPAAAVLASDISSALYYGQIVVTNSDEATDAVSVPFTLNTENVINGNMLQPDATDCAIRTPGGDDVAFMPARSGETDWNLFVASMLQNEEQSYYLYTRDVTGGKVRYFPGNNGMSCNDTASLELGNNFEIELAGYWDTSAEAYTIYKQGAIGLRNGSGNIAFDAFDVATSTQNLLPNGSGDSSEIPTRIGGGTANYEAVDDPVASPDGDTTYLATASAGVYYLDLYSLEDFDFPDGAMIDSVKVYYCVKTTNTDFKVITKPVLRLNGVDTVGTEVSYNGTTNWYTRNEVLTRPGGGQWVVSDIDDLQVGLYLKTEGTSHGRFTQIYVTVTYYTAAASVTATGTANGDHTTQITYDGADLKIYVDSIEIDTAAWVGNVTDNANDWYFLLNNAMPYMEYCKITVNGALQQYIEWEYGSTFHDQAVDTGTADSGTTTTLVDAALTQANDYWDNVVMEITTTTDGLAPQGETAIITDFTAADDTLHFAALTAAVDAGDTYTLRHDVTPTFRSATSDPDVSAELVSFGPVNLSIAPDVSISDAGWELTDTPPEPAGMYSELDLNFFGAGWLVKFATDMEVPLALLVFPYAFGLAIVLGLLAFKLSMGKEKKGLSIRGSLLVQASVSLLVILYFVITGDGVLPAWCLLPFLIEAVVLSIKRETYNPWS